MVKEQTRSGRGVRGATFALIFCAAVILGLWSGAHARTVRAGANGVAANAANQTVDERSPFYCNTKALSKEEWAHKDVISRKMRSARLEIKELPNGYAFRYRAGTVSLEELADWVTTEARCCPFFDMSIQVEREGGPVWLTLSGTDGVKQFIVEEFKLRDELKK